MLKYKVLGPRVLIKVNKFSSKTDQTYAGTSIVMAEQVVDQETTAQTIGEVVQLGSEAYKREDIGCSNKAWVKKDETPKILKKENTGLLMIKIFYV